MSTQCHIDQVKRFIETASEYWSEIQRLFKDHIKDKLCRPRFCCKEKRRQAIHKASVDEWKQNVLWQNISKACTSGVTTIIKKNI